MNANSKQDLVGRANAAIAAWHSGDSDEAISVFRELVDEEPNDARCLYILGGYLWKAGRSEEAIPFLKKAAKLSPGHQVVAETLFNVLWETGAKKPAADVLRQLLKVRQVDEIAELLEAVESDLTDGTKLGSS